MSPKAGPGSERSRALLFTFRSIPMCWLALVTLTSPSGAQMTSSSAPARTPTTAREGSGLRRGGALEYVRNSAQQNGL